MEWVEFTSKTIEEAKDAALDELGVDEQDAEFEVLEEPRTGLFGRVRGEARVRARVAPRQHRQKADRGNRPRRATAPSRPSPADGPVADGAPVKAGAAASRPPRKRPATTTTGASRARPTDEQADDAGKDATMEGSTTLEEQAEVMTRFLEGLLEAFGADGTVTARPVDDDTVELDVTGEDLGLLIGPKGQTLQAIQELARTVVQRRAAGPPQGWVRVDVNGYRQRRRDALERFVQQVSDEVVSTQTPKALEPMGAADRKVVHDTVNDIAGVATSSRGEEPRRHVVIEPAAG